MSSGLRYFQKDHAGVSIRVEGIHYLGAAMGNPPFIQLFIQEKVGVCIDSEVAKTI